MGDFATLFSGEMTVHILSDCSVNGDDTVCICKLVYGNGDLGWIVGSLRGFLVHDLGLLQADC